MDLLSVVKRETWRTGGVALYLFICLGFFTTLGKLLLATYQIEYYPLLPTVIGTLALAKVVVLLDMTPLTMLLETRHPIWVATLYKTLFYCAISAPVLILERVWHFHREAGSWREAVEQTWTHADQNRVLAKVLIVRLRLWLLPPLPWNRSSSGERSALAHDSEQRIKALAYGCQTVCEWQIRRLTQAIRPARHALRNGS